VSEERRRGRREGERRKSIPIHMSFPCLSQVSCLLNITSCSSAH
jgi:hypothetical protein